MKNLEPKFTKLRVYLKNHHIELVNEILSGLSQEFVEECRSFSDNTGALILEIVAARTNIHQRIVPWIEEHFPESFITMEAVCGYRISGKEGHQLYGR